MRSRGGTNEMSLMGSGNEEGRCNRGEELLNQLALADKVGMRLRSREFVQEVARNHSIKAALMWGGETPRRGRFFSRR